MYITVSQGSTPQDSFHSPHRLLVPSLSCS